MTNNAFEVTKDDIQIVLRAHNTVLTAPQMDEVMDALDFNLVTSSALYYTDFDDQTKAALSEIETQMIAEGLYITDPQRFPLPPLS